MRQNDVIVLNEVAKKHEHVDAAGSRHVTPSEYLLWCAAPDGVQTNVADVAFGNNEVSLTYEDFLTRVAAVQDMFDSGKTVMKTRVLLDENYLRAMHVVRGDDVDQHTLCSAIMAGCESLRPGCDDVQYVGVMRVGTDHVCYDLIMVDTGEGATTKDESQHGVMSASQVREFKRAVDASLGCHVDRTPIATHA